MHTVEQASKLWCPMVRRDRQNGATFNRGTPSYNPLNVTMENPRGGVRNNEPALCNCIADKCAMWRWLDVAPRKERTHASVIAQTERRGYCGIAGRPEVSRA